MEDLSGLTVLSIEQATTLPFMTLRLAEEGARVIRLEPPGRGDPNRWVGPEFPDGERGMNAYFLPNNLGKQAITLNLRHPKGVEILHRLIEALPVDIFATNQRPRSYAKLGIDYETLRAIRPSLIWVGITGFGPDNDEAAYDPILQARAGFMDLTGEPDGDPMVFGLPMVDLGAGEHAYGQVMKALYRREVTGEGSRIDVSMFQSAVSWMVSPILLFHNFNVPSTRHGNTHQFFAPASVFPTADGFVYLAVGNDQQWKAITGLPGFESMALERYSTNAGRIADVAALNDQLSAITRQMASHDLMDRLKGIGVPVSTVHTVQEVCRDPLVAKQLVRARDPHSGLEISVAPPPVTTEYLAGKGMELSFPPRLGEHNQEIIGNLGYDMESLLQEGVI